MNAGTRTTLAFIAAASLILGGCNDPDTGVTPETLGNDAAQPVDTAILDFDRESGYGVLQSANKAETLGECLELAADHLRHGGVIRTRAGCFKGDTLVGAFTCMVESKRTHGVPYPVNCERTDARPLPGHP